jgi:hypothetical protein
MSREAIAEHVLKSLQQAEPSVKMLSVPNIYFQQISPNSMYMDLETNTFTKQHIRFVSDLLVNQKEATTGNLWLNSPVIYSTIK